MKKIYKKLIVAAASLVSLSSIAQVSAYSFVQSSGTYNAVTGGTVFGATTSDDERFVNPAAPLGGTGTTGVGLNIGFNFTYNGIVFDVFGINNNGWISLGQSTLAPNHVNLASGGSSYDFLSSTSTAPAILQNRIGALGNDLQGQTGSELRVETIGTAPNRTLVVQWTNYRAYNVTGDNMNFQIRLSETTNVVEVVYGTFTTATAGDAQIGLRGSTSADFNNRNVTSPNIWSTSIAGVSNAAYVNFNSTLVPVSGQSYKWTPPPVCSGAPSANNSVASPTSVCFGGSSNLSLSTTYTIGGITYQWQSATALAGPYTSITNATLSTLAATSITTSTYYQCIITCTAGPASTTSTPVQIVIPATTTSLVPYFEGFEGISVNNELPNCSWVASNLPTICQTYTATPPPTVYNRIPHSGSKFASFRYGTNAAGDYFYSNGIQLTAGTTYSASVFYIADGLGGWSQFSLSYGTTQTSTGLTQIASTSNITNTTYNQLSGLFTVPVTGVYYIAVMAIGNSTPWYLTWDDLSVTAPPICSGAPASNTAVTSASVVCPGGTANLTLANTYTGTGLSYQWFSAPSVSGPYTAITNATTTAYTATNITTATFYQNVITCSNGPASTTSTPVQVGITTNPCQCNAYCSSGASFTGDDEIFNVSIGTLNNTSACGQTGGPGSTLSLYSNYTGMLAAPNLTVGNTYTISVTVGQCNGSPYSGGVTVYMDLNNNGSFSDPGEQVYASASTLWAVTGTTLSAPITIPVGSTIGITRMRVIASEANTSYTACGTYGYGETEDYCINIAAAPTCTAASGGTLTSSSISACNGATVNISSTGATIGSGIVYQWMVSSTPSGPYTNVVGGSGAAGLSYTTAALSTGTYYYVLQTTCTTASLTGISNEGTVTINPIPTVAASPSNTTICVPGSSSVTLNGSGAATYTWSPGASLSNTVGTSVSALPNTTTTYTVIGASAAGCTNVATATINVNIGLVVDSVAINPAVICSGSNATLMAYAANPAFTYCQATYANGTGFGDYISSVILGSLTNTSVGAPSPYYTFYPQSLTTTTLTAGSTYTISLVAGTYGTNDVAAFIDYNQNGSLVDAGEKLGEVDNFGAAPTSVDIVFTVPATATNGKVRLRVREMDHSTTNDIDPCLVQSSFGETEDYEVTIVGGVNPPFTYAWSPSTFLSSTSTASTVANAATLTTAYTVSVSNANGCSATGAKTLSVNPLPVVSISGNTAVCTGGSAVLTASGATTYSWNTSASTSTISVSPVTTTTYSVLGTNSSNCSNTATFTVAVNATPTLVLGASQTSVCAGSTVNIGVTGATNYTWSTGSNSVSINPTVSATTNYSVVGSTNGCASNTNITITANANPTVSATTSASLICNGSPAVLTATGATTYSWNTSATTSTISVTPSVTTSYTVTGTTNGCSNTFVISQAVSGCVGIDTKAASATGILVYPNPNTGEFTIELNNGSIKNIDVMDLTGRVIISNTSSNDKVDFNINTLANGIYYVRIQSNNTVEVIKIVKQ